MSRVEEIKARLAKATPGQWNLTGLSDREVYVTVDYKQTVDGRHQANWIAQMDDGDDDKESETMYADAEFIANAPDDIAYLLEENKRLREALEEILQHASDTHPGGYYEYVAKEALEQK